jgi:8-oxo-dGTP pyrophosphatase MutT (NUDIX family)
MLEDHWTVLDEAEVLAAPPFVRVTRQRVALADGKIIDDYYQVLLPDYAIGCALTDRGEVLTLWQYKHGTRSFGLTFPAGGINAGETPEAAMIRELREETGYAPAKIVSLGVQATSSNQRCSMAHLFLLEGCTKVAEPHSGDLETMELRTMSPEAVDAAARAGDVAGLPNLAIWTTARALHPASFRDTR